jgi:O-antigen/teichoic acid export membrane protein
MNLTLPFEQMKGALVMLALPYAARVAGQGGKAGARILGTRLTWASAAGAIMYWAVIIPLYKPIFHLLYSNRYLDVAYLLPALALGQVFWSATFGPSLALRAMESPAAVFAALGIATVASLMVGVPATWLFGLKGAIWGSNAADVFSFIALWWALNRKLSGEGGAALPSKWFGSKPAVSSVPVEVSEEV